MPLPGSHDFMQAEAGEHGASMPPRVVAAWAIAILAATILFFRALRRRKRVFSFLPSDPAVLTRVARALGLKRGWRFVDVLGLDEGELLMVPRPCAAVILLCPSGGRYTAVRDAERASGQGAAAAAGTGLVHITQSSAGACGSIAIFHAMSSAECVAPDSVVAKTRRQFEPCNRVQRAELFASSADIWSANEVRHRH